MQTLQRLALVTAVGLGLIASSAYAQTGGPGGTTTTTPGAEDQGTRTGQTDKTNKKAKKHDSTQSSGSMSHDQSSANQGTPDAAKPSTNNDSGTGAGSTGSSTKQRAGKDKNPTN